MILDIQGLRSGYGRLTVLYDVDFNVDVGEMVMLRGPNGAGKSTLLKTILGVLPARQGTIAYRGKRVSHEPTHARFAAGISLAPEGRRIFSRLTVMENLMSGAYGVAKDAVDEQLERVFTLFPVLGERRTQRGGSLSGGEQQMLSIGRALMSRPRLLMVDELSLGLAPLVVERLLDTLLDLCDQGLAVIVVDEFASQVSSKADRIFELQKGRMLESTNGSRGGLSRLVAS
jgi:branched-chain amino acid transport system ATP-binding protein